MESPAPMLSDEGVIFYHMPPDVAKSFQVAVIFFSLFFGMTVLDLVSHIAFDLRLLRKSGWSTPVKAGSRLAYLTCRYMSFIALLLVIVYLVAPQANCEALPRTFNILGMFILDCVTLIFVQRVMALHGYERAVVLPLAAGFAIVVALSIVSIPFYGTGERLPGSVYCYYNPHRNEERTRAVNITYKGCAMILDFAIMLLTLHRLVTGGIRGLLRHGGRKDASTLSSLLIKQGFHFYAMQTATDVLFLVLYWTFDETSYQMLGTASLLSVPSILAGSVYRDTGKAASNISPQDGTRASELAGSSPSSAASPPNYLDLGAKEAQRTQSDTLGYGLGLGISGSGTGRSSRLRARREERNGVLVTVGTVSRTDDGDWLHFSGQRNTNTTTENSASEVEMQRRWPRLSALRNLSGDDTCCQSGERRDQARSERIAAMSAQALPRSQKDENCAKPETRPRSSSTKTNGTSRSKGSPSSREEVETLDYNRVPRRTPYSRSTSDSSMTDLPWSPHTPSSPYPHTPTTTYSETPFLTYPSASATSVGRQRALSPSFAGAAAPSASWATPPQSPSFEFDRWTAS